MAAALVIIDVQRSLIEDGTWEPDRILDGVSALESAARSAGSPIYYVTNSRVEPHAELHSRLSPRVSDRQITKADCDSFLDTNLQADLDAAGITRLVACGLQTDFCIDTTCRRAASLGHQVTLVADAHSTSDRDYLSAGKFIEHHNRILGHFSAGAGRVFVVPSDQVEFG